MRLFVYLLFLAVLLVCVGFAVINAEPVAVSYYFGELTAPLSLIVVIAIIAGALLGIIAGLGMVLGAKREMSGLRRQLRLKEKEVSNLRAIPIRDEH
ncbi:MAG: LapA family protein [Gammaproteobacteria bacterium]|nr:LapA family protein [Gammaproteobacteria bacterium]